MPMGTAGDGGDDRGLTVVVQLASGFGGGGLALKSDGTVWGGQQRQGQLCDGTTNARPTPGQIPVSRA